MFDACHSNAAPISPIAAPAPTTTQGFQVGHRRIWITADIYLKTPAQMPPIGQDDRLREFLVTHRVEENKFASFAAAEQLFTEAGFALTRREGASPIRQTWMLGLSRAGSG